MKNLQRQKTFAFRAESLTDNTLRGIASVAGVLDSYDDVIMPGAFTDEVLADFLATGFVAEGHDWRQMIAMPRLAQMRGNALYTEAEFHSTDDAQAIRTKCQERIDRGLSVGLSVGFSISPVEYKTFASGPALLKWAEAAGYSLSELDAEALGSCMRRCAAIVRVAKLYEYSVVAAPANPDSWAIEVRNAPLGDTATIQSFCKSQYLGPWAEAYAAFDALCSLTSDLEYGPVWDAVFGAGECDGMNVADRIVYLRAAYAEYSAISLRIAEALIALADESAAGAPADEDCEDELVEMSSQIQARCRARLESAISRTTPTSELPAGPLVAQAEAALAAVEAVQQRMASLQALRDRDGRSLSSANHSRLERMREQSSATARQIASLLSCTDPTEGAANAVPDTARLTQLRLDLLRAQNRRRMDATAI